MLLCAAGDTHGELVKLYERVASLEAEVGRRVDLVVQVGDFGVWPDPERLDAATRRHGDSGELRRLLEAGAAPRPTVFIAGNHEDFDFLAGHPTGRLVEGLTFLPWGQVMDVEIGDRRVRIGGIGGCFGARDFRRNHLQGSARRHYCEADLRRLRDQAAGGLDILLLHEPPAGSLTELHAPPGFRPRSWTLVGEGLSELIAAVRPRICFTGHIHARTERRIQGIRTVGLNKVPYRGSVLLFELPDGGEPRDLAEWGGAPGDERPIVEQAVEVEDLATLDELIERLEDWAAEVLGGRELHRDERKRLHATLAREPLRAVLMGALLGGDARELVERHVPAGEREALLTAWSSGGLPDPARLR